MDIFGDFLYVLRLDKWGFYGYNPGKKDLTYECFYDMGFGLNCRITAASYKDAPFPISLHFPPPNTYDYIISNILLWITCG